MPLWFRVARIWLPIAVAVTALTGLVYLGVQQSYRNGLDDPQLTLATDGALALSAGATPASIVATRSLDAEQSLGAFVTVFGPNDERVASDGSIGASEIQPPKGLIDAARTKGTSRVTWQPRRGVRIATVSVAAKDGSVVLAGRNMRAVEARIDDLGHIVAIAWAVTLAAVLIAVVALEMLGLRLEAAA